MSAQSASEILQALDDQEKADSLGLTLEDFRNLRKPKPRQLQKPRSPSNPELKAKFNEQMAAYATAKDKRERDIVRAQLALKAIFAPVLRMYSDDLGGKYFLRMKSDNLAVPSSLEWAVSYAAKHTDELGIILTNKTLTEHVRTWADKVEGIATMPSSFSLDPNDLTFNRIKVELSDGPTPTWDYFIGKCGPNGNALMAFIWSLLNREDRSQQYLFLKGPGKDGKGSLTRWLDKLFNEQLVGLSASDKYWPAQCVGRRVGVFNDLNNTSVVMTSQFKQVTGGDKITVEQKYEKAVSLTLDTKFILTTNRSINIIGDGAERRRAILVEIAKDNSIIEDYEEKLEQEGAAFLFKCRAAYESLYDKKTKEIKCDYSFFESESASYEEPHETLFERHFYLDEKGATLAAEFFTRINAELGRDNNKVGSFKEWLERTHGIKRSRNKSSGKAEYRGIRTRGSAF